MTTIRRATLGDLDAVIANVQSGFDFYRSFVPPGWQPPQARRGIHEETLTEPGTLAWMALVDDKPVGHVSFYPARERRPEGYEHARLFTPSAHARARRFYERRGRIAHEEQWHDGLALLLTEYRLALGA